MIMDNDEIKIDGGYGVVGNMIKFILLETLNDEDKKSYEEQLRKENPQRYEEFLEYCRQIDKSRS